ncbi:MAG TPA: MarR family transcriptional regulator [Actinomycetota bacterium]
MEEPVVERPDGLKHLSPLYAGAFVGLLRAAEGLEARLSVRLEREHGLSLRGFEVLLFLSVFAPEGELRMSDLAEQTPLSQSRVSRLVADLEARGLVRRIPAESDGRGVGVSVTKEGIERFRAAQESHLADLEELLFSNLSETEVRRLAAITGKIVEACREGER